MSLQEAQDALKQLAEAEHLQIEMEAIRELLQAADITGAGTLNYLEFLRCFDRQDPKCLTHKFILDTLCFQVWLHRNALSGLFRYIGNNGHISKSQIQWALHALNKITDGKLDDANIESIVQSVMYSEGTVVAEEFLHSFDIVDHEVQFL